MDPNDESLRRYLALQNEDMILLDGFDSCIVGVAERLTMAPVATYSVDKIREVLLRDGCDEDSVDEYISFNITGLWAGPHTPVFLHPLPEDT